MGSNDKPNKCCKERAKCCEDGKCEMCCPHTVWCPRRCVLCTTVCCEITWELGCCQPPPPPPPWMDSCSLPPKIFTWCFKDRAPLFFVIMRICLFISWFGVMIWQSSAYKGTTYGERWGAYVTNWSLVWQTVYLTFAATTTTLAFLKKQPWSCCVKTPWYAHVTWAMHMTAVIAPVMTAIIYWIFIHDTCETIDGKPPEGRDDCAPDVVTYGTLNIHLINALVAVLDFCIHEHWYPPWDICYPVCFGTIYLIFCFLYYKQTGFIVYESLDWSESGAASMFGLMIVLTVIPAFYSFFAWMDMLFKQRKLFKILKGILNCLIDWITCCWCKCCCGPPPKPKRDLEAPLVNVACQTEGGTSLAMVQAAMAEKSPNKRSSLRKLTSAEMPLMSSKAVSCRRSTQSRTSERHSMGSQRNSGRDSFNSQGYSQRDSFASSSPHRV